MLMHNLPTPPQNADAVLAVAVQRMRDAIESDRAKIHAAAHAMAAQIEAERQAAKLQLAQQINAYLDARGYK